MKSVAESEKGEQDALVTEVGTLKSENTKLATELRVSLNKIESLEEELKSTKENYDNARNELEKLRQELKESKETIDRLGKPFNSH